MNNDLPSLYESVYLNYKKNNQGLVSENAETEDEGEQKPAAKAPKKKKGGKGDDNIGGITYDSVNNAFDSIIREMDEDFGADSFGNDDAGGFDGDSLGGDEFGDEEDEQITVSKSLLRGIIDQLKELIGEVAEDDGLNDLGGDGEEFGGEEGFGGGGDDDEIPLESYGFDGDGKYHGDQGTYDGKAKRQGQSNHVKSNGNANVDKTQDTGYEPDDDESGHEGSEHGAQGTYDGKAKRQGQSNHVQSNGNAKVGSTQNTGYKRQAKENLF